MAVTHPTVLIPIHNLGRDGFRVATLGPHFFPQGIILGDVHQVVLDVLPVQDPGHLALLGLDLQNVFLEDAGLPFRTGILCLARGAKKDLAGARSDACANFAVARQRAQAAAQPLVGGGGGEGRDPYGSGPQAQQADVPGAP